MTILILGTPGCLFELGLSPLVNVIGTAIGGCLGGLVGGIIGANIKTKESEIIEFIPDPNSIKSQREMVSKLVYK